MASCVEFNAAVRLNNRHVTVKHLREHIFEQISILLAINTAALRTELEH